jgi:hypothetical protein
MKRKNLFFFLSRNNRNDYVGIGTESRIVIFGTIFTVAYTLQRVVDSSGF